MMVEKIDKGIDVGSAVAAAFIIGWMSSSYWHQTAVTDKAAQVLPQALADAGCEHSRAEKNRVLALGTDMVALSQIPKDCPRPKPGPPPSGGLAPK